MSAMKTAMRVSGADACRGDQPSSLCKKRFSARSPPMRAITRFLKGT
jgi:hypothetical protein